MKIYDPVSCRISDKPAEGIPDISTQRHFFGEIDF